MYSDVLLDGKFSVLGGSNAYSECKSSLNGLTIVGYYENKHICDVNSNMIIINGRRQYTKNLQKGSPRGVIINNDSFICI